MATYPIEIRRCRHVKTNGTQCGSPALKGKELCFYHEQNQPREVELYIDGERYSDGSMVMPAFDDAHAIQTVIRQVVQLMLARRIERKDAGLLLYALQIASGNLKMMQAEKAKPTQVVVEPEKAAETPLGMTPWSATGQGHDREEAEGGETEAQNPPASPPSPEEFYAAMSAEERMALRKDFEGKGLIRPGEFEGYLMDDAPDPLLLAITRLWEERECRKRAQAASSQSPDGQGLPPGSIQACQARRARMRAVNPAVRQAPSRKAREGAHPRLFRFMSKTNLGYSSALKRPTRRVCKEQGHARDCRKLGNTRSIPGLENREWGAPGFLGLITSNTRERLNKF